MIAMPIRLALTLVVLIAAVTDSRARRIPNWLTFPAIAIGLAAQGVYGAGIVQGLLGACAGFVVPFVIFALGGGGGGDVKLMTAVGAFLGPRDFLMAFVLIALLGGAAALVVAIRAGALGRTLRNAAGILGGAARGRWSDVRQRSDLDRPESLHLPYGVVIAGGTLVFLWLNGQ